MPFVVPVATVGTSSSWSPLPEADALAEASSAGSGSDFLPRDGIAGVGGISGFGRVGGSGGGRAKRTLATLLRDIGTGQNLSLALAILFAKKRWVGLMRWRDLGRAESYLMLLYHVIYQIKICAYIFMYHCYFCPFDSANHIAIVLDWQ